MKKIAKNRVIHKITMLLILAISLNVLAPKYSFAAEDDGNGIAGGLLKEVIQLFASLGDVVMGGLNHFMLGTAGVSSSMLEQNDVNLSEKGKEAGSWLVSGIDNVDELEEQGVAVEKIPEDYMDKKTFLLDASEFKIPNMLYSPENIFANNIAMLDVNFLNPNSYTSAVSEGENEDEAENMSESAAGKLQETISSWYKSFRNIAIVGLLSVLVYLGIRILISTTASDKAKYKESLKDWTIALVLVFVIHFIMSAILMFTNAFTDLFGDSIDKGIIVETTASDGDPLTFRTNLIGLARFKAQADAWQDATAYTIIYLALVIYTIIFTVIYFKRFLWMAFFTMIAPLVALTYPIDRAGDGHAQAFNLWFKEYTMNAILQPVHLILYTVFVSSATQLAADNPIYAIVAIAFLLPAEKFIKKMFGFDKAETAGGFGSFAGGALTMKGLNMLSHLGKGKSGSSGKSGGSDNGDSGNGGKINFAKTANAGKLGEFASGGVNQDDGTNRNTRLLDGQENEQDNNTRLQQEQEPEQNNNRQSIFNEQPEDNSNNNVTDGFISEGLEDGNIPTWQQMRNMKDARDMFEEQANNDALSEDEREVARQRLESTNRDIEEGKNRRKNRRSERLERFGNFALRGAKPLGKGLKFAGKGLLRATGAIGGATVGLAAGLTTGDMSNAVSMAAAGAVAGNMIGKTAGTIPGRAIDFGRNQANSIREIPGNIEDAWNEEMHGPEIARQRQIERQNNRARNRLLRDDDERKKARELAGKMGYNGPTDGIVNDILNAKADLREQGIKDEDLINDTISTEYKQEKTLTGKKHDQYVSAAGYINKNNYSKADIDDVKKMHSFEERVQAELPGDQKAQNQVMSITTGILGADKLYKMRQQAGETKIKPISSSRQSQSTQSTRQTRQTQPQTPPTQPMPRGPRTQGPTT